MASGLDAETAKKDEGPELEVDVGLPKRGEPTTIRRDFDPEGDRKE